eukprot:TRINITY_DN4405_c3_g1_i1.p1 TRINITY_DN4405_c3_g1~~TRINITY_DN4405_c3_g1_i1.p1  ORF type:complete len:298 (-),score=75.81 TRINITY_DN4405_c3_g1_i1:60-953(-)
MIEHIYPILFDKKLYFMVTLKYALDHNLISSSQFEAKQEEFLKSANFPDMAAYDEIRNKWHSNDEKHNNIIHEEARHSSHGHNNNYSCNHVVQHNNNTSIVPLSSRGRRRTNASSITLVSSSHHSPYHSRSLEYDESCTTDDDEDDEDEDNEDDEEYISPKGAENNIRDSKHNKQDEDDANITNVEEKEDEEVGDKEEEEEDDDDDDDSKAYTGKYATFSEFIYGILENIGRPTTLTDLYISVYDNRHLLDPKFAYRFNEKEDYKSNIRSTLHNTPAFKQNPSHGTWFIVSSLRKRK